MVRVPRSAVWPHKNGRGFDVVIPEGISLTGRVTGMRNLPPASVDFALTDSLYLVGYQSRNGRKVANDRIGEWLRPASVHPCMFACGKRKLRRGRAARLIIVSGRVEASQCLKSLAFLEQSFRAELRKGNG
jgi:hypothetical protein